MATLFGLTVILIGIGCTFGGAISSIFASNWQERTLGVWGAIVGLFILYICFS